MENVSSKPVLSNVDLYNWGDSTVYHYYVHDNQGSVRVVIGENGAIKQATDYSAYGVPSTRYEGTSTNNHLHLGLEWQSMKGLYGYYNNARFRDALLAGTFFQQDPLSEKYYPYTPYHYGTGNPLRYTDKSGEIIETVWDALSLATGVASFYNNIQTGNYGDAVADGVGVIVDAAAVIIPGVPGGVGSAIKASRVADDVTDVATCSTLVVKKIDSVVDTKGTQKTYQTYTKKNKVTGEIYTGRTSGVKTPEENIRIRDKNHHMNNKGYDEAQLDKSSLNPDAIRGREQYLIDINGGAKSQGGTSGNRINGISRKNPNYSRYMNEMEQEFK